MDAVYSQLLSRVVEIYHRALINSAQARDWLAGKGLVNPALLDRFQVGFSEGTLAAMARGEVAERLRTLGLLDGQGKERFAGSIVIPVFDLQDSVVQIAGYAADGAVSWLFPEETPAFWNAPCVKCSKDVLVVPDPLIGLLEIVGGREAVIAPGGPGVPLGRDAKDLLVAHGVQVTLKDCEPLRPELEAIGAVGPAKKSDFQDQVVEQDANGFTVEFPRRLRFIVQGISQDSPRHLRASIKVFRRSAEEGAKPRIHLDTFDLFHARSRIGFAKTAACLLGEDPTLMEDFLGRLVSLSEEFLKERDKAPATVLITESEKSEALDLLRDSRFPECVATDLCQLGYVGEDENKLVAYLASVSRKLEDPLSVLVLSRSAAGKSTLSDAVGSLCPPEDLLRFTRLTAQTLYYQKPDALAHKLVFIEEAEGVQDATYALRVLQSARRLSLSTAAGKGDARTREVRGPVSLFVTSTRTDLDEETAGRFLTLSVDESREQTRAILAAQRQAEARPAAERDRLLRLHQNIQRMLQPAKIVNPFAPYLTFPDDRLSARRDHGKYLGLIRAVAFARQHQREVEDGAVVVVLEDIALANRLAHHALGHSVYDLAPPSRRLLHELRDWLKERARKDGVEPGDVRFSQRELRERVGWKKTQLAAYLKDLVQAEYVVVHMAGPGRRTRYALDWNGEGLDGERFYKGLVDTTTLEALHTSGSLPAHVRDTSGARKPRRKRLPDAITQESPPSDRTSGERVER